MRIPSLKTSLSRFAALFRKRKLERELDDELRAHLDFLTEENLHRGMSPEEARRAALRTFGGEDQTKEAYRDQRGIPMLETLLQDLRYGLRMLVKNPGFTLVAVVTLALGIGVNTTIFSFVNAFMLRRPPVADPDRVMMLCSKSPKGDWMPEMSPVSGPDFLDWRRQSTSYAGMAAGAFYDFTLSGTFQPERVPGAAVSPEYFQVLGVAPIRGRSFEPGEDQPGSAKVAMISESLWRDHFAADPGAIGRTFKIDGESYTLVGVVSSRFRMWIFPAQVWVPLQLKPDQADAEARQNRALSVFARLKPGVSQQQAQSELASIAQRLAADYPATNKGFGSNVVTLQKYIADTSNTAPAMTALMGAVTFVLLIACANLANLLLARNAARRREFAIRAALGAGRMRLIRQLLSECLLLSLAGAALGLAFSVAGLRVIRAQINWNEFAYLIAQEVYIDRSVLLFTLAASVISAMAFGLAPALQISRSGPGAGLQENSRTTVGGRQHRRLQNLLVMGEITLSLILLVGAGLFVRSFVDELRAAPGFDPHNVLTASISLSGESYKTPERRLAFVQNALRGIENMPEVQSAAVTRHLPFQFPDGVSFSLEGQPATPSHDLPSAGHFLIGPHYFQTAKIPLLEGREFTAADNAGGAPVVMVNQAFARKYFAANQDPLGRHIQIQRDKGSATWSEIVGVVANVNEFSGQISPRPHLFEPLFAHPPDTIKFLIRTRGDPLALAASLRGVVAAVDKDQALTSLRTMDKVIVDSAQGDDLMAELMGTFAALALLMAAVGIYGLLAYLVGQRTQEFGVRMALGAGRGEIVLLVLRNVAALVATGAGIGFLISLALPKLFAAGFNGFHVSSGLILAGAPITVVLVALASCLIPARRAAKVDPMVALRYE